MVAIKFIIPEQFKKDHSVLSFSSVSYIATLLIKEEKKKKNSAEAM